MNSIEVSGLSKVYKGGFTGRSVTALEHLDLNVEAGEVFGLLGPNGAGKTTLVKILLGVVHPTSGKAELDGISVTQPASRRRIGFLPENHRFPDFLTPDQMLNLYGRLAGIPADVRQKRIPELLEMVNMAQWHDTKIKKFSKGMMQRVGIAQALMNDPAVVFLDEPTDGVDPIGRREIRDVLMVLKDQGKTIFLNSHLLSEVEQMCTSVAILNKGKKVKEGTVADLTRVDTHFDLFTTPVAADVLDQLKARFTITIEKEKQHNAGLIRYRLSHADRSSLNELIDLLRNADVQIEEVRPMRQSLEERFVKEISDEKPA